MDIGRPPLFKFFIIRKITTGGDVVQKRVEPDVRYILAVKRQVDAPAESGLGARNAQVSQRLAQKSEDFIFPVLGTDERGVVLNVGDELFLILAHLKKIIFLF